MEPVLVLIIFIVVIVGFVAYIIALVNAAKHRKWVWFVLMLLFWPVFIFYYMGAYISISRGSGEQSPREKVASLDAVKRE